MSIRSSRLILREWNEEDFDLFYSVFTNTQVMKYAYAQAFISKEEAHVYFNRMLDKNKALDDRKEYDYCIFLIENNQFIGSAGIEVYEKNEFGGHGEIGYFLLPGYWGCGYAKETADLLLKLGFTEIGLHRLCASCHIDNKSSESVIKKIGMKKEGQLRQIRFKSGSWHDELRYSILAKEWITP
ncbi:GNAT family N-acetyltransferase [Konateibacter massiliensis]|uniref:GNAT family N-acetyltransferase n=1 Tax=Konateibacter massiliensis TaxID=2002841 RepID=UPI000C156B8C|nr:GNAT family protein [Konateibacter massiliensis]